MISARTLLRNGSRAIGHRPLWRRTPKAARVASSPSVLANLHDCRWGASQSRAAVSTIDSSTSLNVGRRGGDDAQHLAGAVCCSSASVTWRLLSWSSALRCSSSSNSRAFSMAITAWSANVSSSAICCSVNGRSCDPDGVDHSDRLAFAEQRDRESRSCAVRVARAAHSAGTQRRQPPQGPAMDGTSVEDGTPAISRRSSWCRVPSGSSTHRPGLAGDGEDARVLDTDRGRRPSISHSRAALSATARARGQGRVGSLR